MDDLSSRIRVIDILTQMRNLWKKLEDNYRVLAYNKNIRDISMKNYKNITHETYQKINEILESGTLKELKQLQIAVVLSKIPGYGTKKSILYAKGEPIIMTKTMKLGIKYGSKINKNLKRKDVIKISTILKKSFKDYYDKCVIVGSFRRGKKTMGDIDLLVIGQEKKITNIIGSQKWFIGWLGKGIKRLTFLGKFDLIGIVHIDIIFAKMRYYESALLYFTGSRMFNIRMRKKAKKMGWKLNEYGLHITSKRILNGEHEIIKKLNFDDKYFDTKNR